MKIITVGAKWFHPLFPDGYPVAFLLLLATGIAQVLADAHWKIIAPFVRECSVIYLTKQMGDKS